MSFSVMRTPEEAAKALAGINRWRRDNPDIDWQSWLDHLVEEYGCWDRTVESTAVYNTDWLSLEEMPDELLAIIETRVLPLIEIAAHDFDRFMPAYAEMQRTPYRPPAPAT
ncbi:hypothetical protein [Mesorhizobium sp. ZC-5]|uniref:hypothetical protein n=1 Tax=Mesorhizobium sp. ZC-5 TaxID=2986066 RepID=UPI0021E94C3B|nr:hypothetical protein [Mesorhizobium sp. ZC-5]MCV3243471.1 hypothetical protein [Mesorhizobium sp. ZC-5]